MRYFMRLSYRGAPFCGWQIQPQALSVQQAIEEAMSMLLPLSQSVSVTGAGRTDAGVNARMMVAHFDVDRPIEDMPKFIYSLNSILPRDIAIHAIVPVHDTAHARFDATSRTYKYFIHEEKSPFLWPLSWRCRPGLDFELMNEAASRLLNYTDFTSFSKLHTDVKTNNCRVTHARWEKEGEQWVFTITADRFLRNMVRAVVGTLIDVGRHKITVQQFCDIIEKKDRCLAGTSMPGHALYLWDITYPYPTFD
ncbi:MAG: tRNA pseudouridine(38-40) synthase TruA [Muribaculaceae bacterium]|nr:tRNA pseudouridine(38-40) synthase TruA [Muribaculaceae bacterium]